MIEFVPWNVILAGKCLKLLLVLTYIYIETDASSALSASFLHQVSIDSFLLQDNYLFLHLGKQVLYRSLFFGSVQNSHFRLLSNDA